MTHVTNTTGVLYPAREIAALAHRRGIFVHLDGAQTFGALDVNLAETGCHSYAGSATTRAWRRYDALWQRHRVAIAMTGSGDAEGPRFSPHVYNSPEEIDRAVAAVRESG